MKYSIFLFLLLPAFFFALPASAQLAQKYKGYSDNNYKGVRYGLFKPDNYDPKKSYPLVVYLHGSRDTVSRDIGLYSGTQEKYPCFVLTPKCVQPNLGWGSSWQGRHTETMATTLQLVDSLVKKYNMDTDRLYIFGVSMGGFGVFSVLQKNPGKFAAAYAICGGSNPEVADKIMQTPLWIFHGSDDNVVPVNLSRDIYNEIVRLGGKKTKYTEYPGVKHNSWENASREKELIPWLFSQKKG